MKRWQRVLLAGAGLLAAGGVGFYLGSGLHAASAEVAFTQVQVPLQEFIPLPFPGRQPQGQAPGQSQQDCVPTILFYHQGRLYQLQPGPEGQPGVPGSPPEFFYLRPFGQQAPGFPTPRQAPAPNFRPLVPRF
ncbi:MAG: hypothetical protein QN198_00125 [Armatimonadota bacterium]|nr:hypothetical protein [Armatimonadota bacterium]MDR5701986.1 hypothetical protein [Armatimonadota bacterium]MDR7434716.1 hypothetical protein [Armatimonadota bacterium]